MAHQDERVLKSLWHGAIVLMGLYEFRTHKTVVSKVLSVGLMCFHLDATICDWLDRPTTVQRLLGKLRRTA